MYSFPLVIIYGKTILLLDLTVWLVWIHNQCEPASERTESRALLQVSILKMAVYLVRLILTSFSLRNKIWKYCNNWFCQPCYYPLSRVAHEVCKLWCALYVQVFEYDGLWYCKVEQNESFRYAIFFHQKTELVCWHKRWRRRSKQAVYHSLGFGIFTDRNRAFNSEHNCFQSIHVLMQYSLRNIVFLM